MLIKEGITKCFVTENNEKEYILKFFGKGEIVDEIEFIRKIVCLCSIEAMTDVTVYAITPDYFSALVKSDLQLNNLLLDVFAERIINTASRASHQQLYTIEHSLGKLLYLQSKQEISISKEEIASHLGVTVRSLNRAFKSYSGSEYQQFSPELPEPIKCISASPINLQASAHCLVALPG